AQTAAGEDQARFSGARRAQDDGQDAVPCETSCVQDLVSAPGEKKRDRQIQDLRRDPVRSPDRVDAKGVSTFNLQKRRAAPQDAPEASAPLPENSGAGVELLQWREVTGRRKRGDPARSHRHRGASRGPGTDPRESKIQPEQRSDAWLANVSRRGDAATAARIR